MDPAAAAAPATMNVLVRTVTGMTFNFQVPNDATFTVFGLKEMIANQTGVSPADQRIIFSGRELDDLTTLQAAGVRDGFTLHVVLRLSAQPPAAAAAVNPNYQYAPPMGVPAGGGGGGGWGGPANQAPLGAPMGYANPDQVAVGIPVGQDGPAMPILSDEMMKIFAMARTVRMFALIDAAVLIIWTIAVPLLSIGVIMTIAGYCGARQYNPCYIGVYIAYLILSIAFRIWLVAVSGGNVVLILLVAASLIIQLYILGLVWRFFKEIRQLPEADRLTLRQYQRVITSYL